MKYCAWLDVDEDDEANWCPNEATHYSCRFGWPDNIAPNACFGHRCPCHEPVDFARGAAVAFGLMGMAEAIRKTYTCRYCGTYKPPSGPPVYCCMGAG